MASLVRLVGILNLVAGLLSLPSALLLLQPVLFPPENPMGEGVPVPVALPLLGLLGQALVAAFSILGGLGTFLLLPPGRRLLLGVAPLNVAAAALVPGSDLRVAALVLSAALAAFTWAVLLRRDSREAFGNADRWFVPGMGE